MQDPASNTSSPQLQDAFLSEEDLDLENLSDEELLVYWNLWLKQAASTNELDAHIYNHGVFMLLEDEPSNLSCRTLVRSSK